MWWGEGEGEDGCAGVRVKVGVLWLMVFHWDCPALQTTSGRLISSTFQQIPAPWVRKTGSRRSCACQSVLRMWAPVGSNPVVGRGQRYCDLSSVLDQETV